MGEEMVVPIDVGIRLKEMKFEEICYARYLLSGELNTFQSWSNSQVMGCTAPTWEQVIRWLLKHKYPILVSVDVNRDGFHWAIRRIGKRGNIMDLTPRNERGYYDKRTQKHATYAAALESGVREVLFTVLKDETNG